LLALIAITNYLVDPENIYSKNEHNDIAKEILISSYGVVVENINDRDLKMGLTKHAGEFSCVILGSSHVMQISSYRYPTLTESLCPNLLNLGVSAAVIEDIFIFSYVIANLENKPKKILIEIAPWSLNRGRGDQWQRYSDKYDQFLDELNEKKETENNRASYSFLLLGNLLNAQYFKHSIVKLFEPGEIIDAEKFDFAKGYEEKVILPDGSLVYTKSHIEQSKSALINGNGIYKLIDAQWYDEKVIKLLESLVLYLVERDIEVYFILSPYHQNVWKNNPVTVNAMKIVSKIIRQFAREWGVTVLGTYNPDELACRKEQFFDAAHPTGACVNKLFQYQINIQD
jgi:hypothetical protein